VESSCTSDQSSSSSEESTLAVSNSSDLIQSSTSLSSSTKHIQESQIYSSHSEVIESQQVPQISSQILKSSLSEKTSQIEFSSPPISIKTTSSSNVRNSPSSPEFFQSSFVNGVMEVINTAIIPSVAEMNVSLSQRLSAEKPDAIENIPTQNDIKPTVFPILNRSKITKDTVISDTNSLGESNSDDDHHSDDRDSLLTSELVSLTDESEVIIPVPKKSKKSPYEVESTSAIKKTVPKKIGKIISKKVSRNFSVQL
jgi:hypothetical protein